MLKRFLSGVLAITFMLSGIEVIAQDNFEDIIEEEITSQEFEPITYTEEISPDYEYPFEIDEDDEGFNVQMPVNSQDGIMMADADVTTLWKSMLREQFSDEYILPYKYQSGEQIYGNTNRLVYRETDLSLEGKNGLDHK